MEEESVYAVVVTFNRLLLLQKTVAALQAQSRRLAQIVVVNNNSSDGTAEWLDTQIGLVVIHQENVGGSGGFHTGVKKAFEMGADWVWLMDDDALAKPDCLEKLLDHAAISHCINPVHIGTDGSLSDEERWFDPTDCTILNLYNRSYENGKQVWFRNLGSFEGMLVARDVIEKIGFPDPRFFIAHDDLVYGYLASKFTNVAVAANAVMQRQPVVKSEASLYNYDYYYMYRNLWLLEEYADKELPAFRGYRKRRIRWQFFYGVYKILFVDKPAKKALALGTLRRAFRDYKAKKSGKKPG